MVAIIVLHLYSQVKKSLGTGGSLINLKVKSGDLHRPLPSNSPLAGNKLGKLGSKMGSSLKLVTPPSFVTPYKGGNTTELPPWKKGRHRPMAPQYVRRHFMQQQGRHRSVAPLYAVPLLGLRFSNSSI